MVILDVRMDNLYAFKNFHMNLTYPKKIVGSSIEEEHLADRPNFRYKKVNVIMGANASGKTTFGRALMKIFNFIDKKNYSFITDIVGDRKREASFVLDMASKHNIFYRISCKISPCENEKYSSDNISIEIRQENILVKDSYESCVKRIESAYYEPMENYIEWDKDSEDKIYEKIDAWKAKILSITNRNVNKSSQVSSIEVMKEPFEKTATQKIRRFRYKESAPTIEESMKK